ncbi:hypothetical protein PHLGIDRAFT_130579 [Phlebiopsis gigantea 11061_1 CR5-6]|uniref:Uncharacterized protein n=1 Tax=Phlebiopsis gigantea (strain 11061_1 CR5-6) TaxID=745531 RepID=A0A0C3RRK5_PHLG1|nr:hypothetical protein PHLGIDRAFT_130579 [Phlebiopsis gigantea 11061_1 CR5-6]
MSINRSRPTHYEEYREFFSILASGDRTQYGRAQQVFSPSPNSSPTSTSFPPHSLLAAQAVETNYDSSDDSDDSSATAVEIATPEDFKGDGKTVDVIIEEVPRAHFEVAHSPASPLELLISESPATHLPSTANTLPADSPLATLESSVSAVTTSSEELRMRLKQLLRGLYDIETFRGLVRELLHESEAAFQPLKDPHARLPATSKQAPEPIFKGLGDDAPAHTPKKRCLTQAGTSERAGFKGAQRLMDVVSDMMSAQRPANGWKKVKASLPKSWSKPKSAKKRVYTELEQ